MTLLDIKERGMGEKPKRILKSILPWLLALCGYLIFSVTDTLYNNMDNYGIASVINGRMGSDPYCLYQHPFLCFLLYRAALLFKSVDVYTAFTHICLILGLGYFLELLFKRYKRWSERVLIILSVLFLQFVLRIWNTNYTEWAGFFCAVGLFALFGTESERDQRRGALLGAIFIGSGLMQRWQAAFIFIPYFFLESLFRLKVEYDKNKGKKTELKASLFKLLRLVLPTILVFLFLTVTREVFYSNEPYRSGMIYDNMRVITGDYPMEFFTDVKDKSKALEVRESEYKAALSWLHADTEIMDKEKFEAIGKVGARIDFPLTLKGFAACLAKMLKDILESPQRLGIPVLILLLLALLSFFRRQSTEEGIKILITLLGSFIIMYYFVSRGRAPHRVWMPVELATLILILCSGKKERKDRGYDIFLCILSFLLSAAILSKGFSELHFHKLTTAFDSRTAADDGALPYDLKEGSLYLVAGGNEFKGRKGEETFEAGWIRVCKTYTDQGKLAGKEFYRQYIPLGWWFYGQPYYKSLLKEIGAENPMTALFDREDTYLLLYGDDRYDLNMIIEFIYDHYGNMNVKRIESNSEYSLYRFSR